MERLYKILRQAHYSRHINAISLGLFSASLAWLYQGYSFGHGNHGQEIPPILAMIDRSLYIKDFAVQDFILPGTRYVYYSLVAWFSGIFDIGVDVILLSLKVFSQLSFYIALAFIFRDAIAVVGKKDIELSSQDIALFCLLVTAVTFPLLSWGSTIFDPTMTPSTLAMAIAVWSLHFAIKKKWHTAFALSAAAVPVHFLVGFFSALVLIPALIITALQSKSNRLLVTPIIILLIPTLGVYAAASLSDQSVPETFDFLEVFGVFRVPHHWLPSTGTWLEWISDILLLLGAVIASVILWKSNKKSRDLLILLNSIMAVSVSGVMANYFFVEELRIELIGKLQLQRIIPYGHLAQYLIVTTNLFHVFMSKRHSERNLIKFLSIISLILVLPSLLALSVLQSFPAVPFWGFLFVVGILLFAFLKSTLRHFLIAGTLFVLVIFNSPALEPIDKISNKYRPIDKKIWAGKDISDWLREHSHKESLIIIPPYPSIVGDLLAMHSKRSVFFSYKNVPYSNYGVWLWSKRAEELLGIEIGTNTKANQLREIWVNRANEDVVSVGLRYEACYLVDTLDNRAELDSSLIISTVINDEKWGLWHIKDCG